MITNQHGQMIFTDLDICDLIMQGHSVLEMQHLLVDRSVDLVALSQHIDVPEQCFVRYDPQLDQLPVSEFDRACQSRWFMPQCYQDFDIHSHVLSLCDTPQQQARCEQELRLYQQHEALDLLRYLRYLVDIMQQNQIIWGVGRGSSVASYVLYKLGVHHVDSLFYDLDIAEFLR